MKSWIVLLMEASVAIALFYGYYYFFLRKETFFVANRLYLLVTAIFSICIPWLNFSIVNNSTAQSTVFYNVLETVTVSANGYESRMVNAVNGWHWMVIIYVSGVFLSLLLLVFNVLQVSALGKVAMPKTPQNDGWKLILVDKAIVPFSFLNRIYIPKSNFQDEQIQKIIAHEKIHILQRHTYDCLFYECLIVLFWFHPLVYRYRKSAKEIHEYLADKGAIQSGIQKLAYQELLFAQATGLKLLTLPNSFNYSLLKRRLIMLTKIKSSKMARTRYIWAVPVLVAVLLVFACNKMEKANNTKTDNLPNPEEPSSKLSIDNSGQEPDSVYLQVGTMAEFRGGQEQLIKYIMENVKYPETAKKNKIQGKVFVQFDVDANGKICNAKVVRGVHELLDKEALRVINAMPDWHRQPEKDNGVPAMVQFTIPINFKLN